jgi:N utilization substance protein A
VERRAVKRQQPVIAVEDTKVKEVLQDIPVEKLDVNILDSGLPEHVTYLLQEASILTVRDLAYTFRTSPDSILKLQGIGPRAMQEIQNLMNSLSTVAEEKPAEIVEPEAVLSTAEPVVETTITVATDGTGEVPVETPVQAEPEEEVSFDQLFAMKSETFVPVEAVAEEDEEIDDVTKKASKKKKPKHVEVTYDPDRDMTTAVKKHKRGGGWEWEE